MKFNTPQPNKSQLTISTAPRTVSKFGSTSDDASTFLTTPTLQNANVEPKTPTSTRKSNVKTPQSSYGKKIFGSSSKVSNVLKTPINNRPLLKTPKSSTSRVTPTANTDSTMSAARSTYKVQSSSKTPSSQRFSAKKMTVAPLAYKIAFGTRVKVDTIPRSSGSERKAKFSDAKIIKKSMSATKISSKLDAKSLMMIPPETYR